MFQKFLKRNDVQLRVSFQSGATAFSRNDTTLKIIPMIVSSVYGLRSVHQFTADPESSLLQGIVG